MGVILRRLVFGLFWFGVFWIAILIIGGGIAASTADAPPPPPGASYQKGFVHHRETRAGIEFRDQYGYWVIGVAAVLAAACTAAGILPGTRRK
jgi:hypothetical protein